MPESIMKNVGLYLLHLILATMGTGILEWSSKQILYPVVLRIAAPQLVYSKLVIEWIVRIGFAVSFGFASGKYWRSNKLGAYIWILPLALFVLRVFWLFTTSPKNILETDADNLWSRFSGIACFDRSAPLSCIDFYLVTLGVSRSISYSLGTRCLEHADKI
jgi:hypothetical protein